MKLFIGFLVFIVLSSVSCSDANANSTDTDTASNNATTSTSGENAAANLNSTDSDSASNQTASTGEGAAASAANTQRSAAAAASAGAANAAGSAYKCLPKKPHAVPLKHFIHSTLHKVDASIKDKLLEAKGHHKYRHYIKTHHDEISKAVKDMEKFHKGKNNQETIVKGQRYLRIHDKIKHDGSECKLFRGFHRLFIPRVKCPPLPDCNKKTDIGKEENTPVNFTSYYVYAICPYEKAHHLQRIEIKVAQECACKVICKKH